MGRNKKIHDLYDHVLQFRISNAQYNFMCDYSSKLNMSISTYFRKYIDSLMSGDLVSNYILSILNDSSLDEKDKFYLRKSLEVLKKHRKVG